MELTRREALMTAAAGAACATLGFMPRPGFAADIAPGDRVLICNEDSSTLSVIDPATNKVTTTINLTSFDADRRPPFRFVTGAPSRPMPR